MADTDGAATRPRLDGTVIRLFSDFAEVALDAAGERGVEVVTARLRGRLAQGGQRGRPLAVGDRVALSTEGGQSVIEEIRPRSTRLSRSDPSDPRREQVIAANVTRVLVVASAQAPALLPGLVDRYLVAADAEGLPAAICLTKVDLIAEADAEALVAPWRCIGVPTFLVARDDAGSLERLRRGWLEDQVTVLVGQSGVGKTTLRNALLGPGAVPARTGELSRGTGRGRHVTSAATFEPLPPRGFLVDTPGARELGLWRLRPEDVARHFREFADAECRFGRCRHETEPGCGLRDRVARGEASPQRLASLRAIADSLRDA